MSNDRGVSGDGRHHGLRDGWSDVAERLGHDPEMEIGGGFKLGSNASTARTTTYDPGANEVTVEENEAYGFSVSRNGFELGVSTGSATIDKNSVKSSGGMTSYDASVDASSSIGVDIGSPSIDLSGQRTTGQRIGFSVSLPDEVAKNTDLKSINPFDLDSVPVGASIRFDASTYKELGLDVKFGKLEIGTQNVDEEGVSIRIDRPEPGSITVALGPTQLLSDNLSFKATLDAFKGLASLDFSAWSGRTLKSGALTHLSYDIRNGQYTLADQVTRERYDASAVLGGRIGWDLPGDYLDGKFSREVQTYSDSIERSTYLDGSSHVVSRFERTGQLTSSIRQNFNDFGIEVQRDRRYSVEIDPNTLTEEQARELNTMLTGSPTGPVVAGKPVSLSFNEAGLAALVEKARMTPNANMPHPTLNDIFKGVTTLPAALDRLAARNMNAASLLSLMRAIEPNTVASAAGIVSTIPGPTRPSKLGMPADARQPSRLEFAQATIQIERPSRFDFDAARRSAFEQQRGRMLSPFDFDPAGAGINRARMDDANPAGPRPDFENPRESSINHARAEDANQSERSARGGGFRGSSIDAARADDANNPGGWGQDGGRGDHGGSDRSDGSVGSGDRAGSDIDAARSDDANRSDGGSWSGDSSGAYDGGGSDIDSARSDDANRSDGGSWSGSDDSDTSSSSGSSIDSARADDANRSGPSDW